MALMSLLCSTVASNVKMNIAADTTKASLLEVCSKLAPLEPEFILKVQRRGCGKLGARNMLMVCEGDGYQLHVAGGRCFGRE